MHTKVVEKRQTAKSFPHFLPTKAHRRIGASANHLDLQLVEAWHNLFYLNYYILYNNILLYNI